MSQFFQNEKQTEEYDASAAMEECITNMGLSEEEEEETQEVEQVEAKDDMLMEQVEAQEEQVEAQVEAKDVEQVEEVEAKEEQVEAKDDMSMEAKDDMSMEAKDDMSMEAPAMVQVEQEVKEVMEHLEAEMKEEVDLVVEVIVETKKRKAEMPFVEMALEPVEEMEVVREVEAAKEESEASSVEEAIVRRPKKVRKMGAWDMSLKKTEKLEDVVGSLAMIFKTSYDQTSYMMNENSLAIAALTSGASQLLGSVNGLNIKVEAIGEKVDVVEGKVEGVSTTVIAIDRKLEEGKTRQEEENARLAAENLRLSKQLAKLEKDSTANKLNNSPAVQAFGNNPLLPCIIHFCVLLGMDTQKGYICASPVIIQGILCICFATELIAGLHHKVLSEMPEMKWGDIANALSRLQPVTLGTEDLKKCISTLPYQENKRPNGKIIAIQADIFKEATAYACKKNEVMKNNFRIMRGHLGDFPDEDQKLVVWARPQYETGEVKRNKSGVKVKDVEDLPAEKPLWGQECDGHFLNQDACLEWVEFISGKSKITHFNGYTTLEGEIENPPDEESEEESEEEEEEEEVKPASTGAKGPIRPHTGKGAMRAGGV